MNPILNHPDLWLSQIPRPAADAHKYDRGHAQIVGSRELTGATRLAAQACARMGAGLTTVIGGKKSDVYRAALPGHIMVREGAPKDQSRINATLIGPGGNPAKAAFRRVRPTQHALILDAEETYAFRFPLDDFCVLTPHEGEFKRAFPNLEGTPAERAAEASARTGATIVLKGPKTVIAAPDGQLVVNDHASPYLATAGSGDVLAGMITGLSAQGMHPFIASCAAVWMHGEAGLRFGPGLVGADLSEMLPGVLVSLLYP